MCIMYNKLLFLNLKFYVLQSDTYILFEWFQFVYVGANMDKLSCLNVQVKVSSNSRLAHIHAKQVVLNVFNNIRLLSFAHDYVLNL